MNADNPEKEECRVGLAHEFWKEKRLLKPRLMLTSDDQRTMRDRYYWVVVCQTRPAWGLTPSWIRPPGSTKVCIDMETGGVWDISKSL